MRPPNAPPKAILLILVATLGQLPLLAAMGAFTAIQQVAKTTAYRHAEASYLAPYTYSAIIWATLIGWLFWRDLPMLEVILGTVVIIASNLYLVWREISTTNREPVHRPDRDRSA